MGLRDDLSGQVEPLAEVVETLGGEGVVVVLPREAGLDVAAGGQRLACVVLDQTTQMVSRCTDKP